MKKHFTKLALALVASVGVIAASTAAEAYRCKYVPAYWANGYYHQAHKVCWRDPGYYNRSGYYREGYGYRHCGWRNGHRVCW